MRVLMLGWEFPPFITGGLGTACFGLTKALDRRGVEVTFMLPRAVDREHSSHVHLVSPSGLLPALGRVLPPTVAAAAVTLRRTGVFQGPPSGVEEKGSPKETAGAGGAGFRRVRFIEIPAGFSSPYESAPAGSVAPPGGAAGHPGSAAAPFRGAIPGVSESVMASMSDREIAVTEAVPEAGIARASSGSSSPVGADYGGDLIAESQRYAMFCVAASAGLPFDVVHAHDWLTFPAGLAIARVTGKPLVVHVHSTEFDRSGLHVNQRIYDIERRGMHGAIKVVAVSQLTKNLCVNRYAMPASRVEVVYNGVDLNPAQVGMEDIQGKDKIVLYFGRITMQKGPEYFIHAAKRVLDVYKNVKFVVAGSGDQAQRMIELAASLGIGHKVLFTGFLRGKDIQRVFALADLYVMPSVSEPFGIAPLEALGHDVPVLISKTSGVSEVLTHALKVDFWDVDDMANKIVAVLRHPPLGRTLLDHGRFELRRLTWDGAAERCVRVFQEAVAALSKS
ncbi:MAG: glycosyltransferase [Phycisphaerales bacterium]|nr:glycosyltransferase [Phycisphaerales bacterium]